jgi:hypothetical protein
MVVFYTRCQRKTQGVIGILWYVTYRMEWQLASLGFKWQTILHFVMLNELHCLKVLNILWEIYDIKNLAVKYAFIISWENNVIFLYLVSMACKLIFNYYVWWMIWFVIKTHQYRCIIFQSVNIVAFLKIM